jgi:hypothetical protein
MAHDEAIKLDPNYAEPRSWDIQVNIISYEYV